MPNKIKVISIVGARPNFVKIAPILSAIKRYKHINSILVHTGQHYDFEMSQLFFQNLKIPKPDYNLEVGSGSHAWQTAKIIERLEPVLGEEKPNLVIVVGDVNSTLAGALAASKLHIPVAHIEAGLRSFDMLMPEEINRLLTDHISNYLFATEKSAVKNLIQEGISRQKIYLVGNVMIDTLFKLKTKSKKSKVFEELKLKKKEYAVLTLHRPENIDDKKIFNDLIETVRKIQGKIKIIWPVHPRVKKQLRKFNFFNKIKKIENLFLTEPLGYLEMLALNNQAKFILTDSGGLQEESTILGVPCLTLRQNTERPVTVEVGTNIVVGTDRDKILRETNNILAGQSKKGKCPKYWDGKTSQRIVKILLKEIK